MKTLHELEADMLKHGLQNYLAAMKPFARNAIRIEPDPTGDDTLPIGTSKYGGRPDLPASVGWFRHPDTKIPLSFLAQINLADVKPFDTDDQLPACGLLSVFYDCSMDGMPWGFEPGDAAGWKVFFYDGDSSTLERKDIPHDLEENGVLFGSAQLTFESRFEVPAYDSDLCDLSGISDEEEERYWDWLNEEDEPVNKLLGHADTIQSGMELECEYVTNGINCGSPEGYQQAKALRREQYAKRWRLLMQIDSHDELGMMWGDMGRLYLWITSEDLAARRFDKVWLILQCG